MTLMILTLRNHSMCYEMTRLMNSCVLKNVDFIVRYIELFNCILDNKTNSPVLLYDNKPWKDSPSLILIRVGAVKMSKPHNLFLIREFERLPIKCINPSDAIAASSNKIRTAQLLHEQGIPIPKTIPWTANLNSEIANSEIQYPIVMKQNTGSLGTGVYLCNNETEYNYRLKKILYKNSTPDIFLQEYKNERVGEDLRVIVIGGKILGVMNRKAQPGEFRSNISKGGFAETFPLDKNIQDMVLATCETLHLHIAGVDLLFDKDGYCVCEANSNPGFQGFEKYCPMDVADAIIDYAISQMKEIKD